jgi:hypothetical protein
MSRMTPRTAMARGYLPPTDSHRFSLTHGVHGHPLRRALHIHAMPYPWTDAEECIVSPAAFIESEPTAHKPVPGGRPTPQAGGAGWREEHQLSTTGGV